MQVFLKQQPSSDEDEYAGPQKGCQAPTESSDHDGQCGARCRAVLGVGGGHQEEGKAHGDGALYDEVHCGFYGEEGGGRSH